MLGEQVLPILHYKHPFHTGSVPSNLHVSVPIHSGLSDPAGLQGCRAWLLRRSQFCSYIPCGPCEDCLAFMGHSIFGGQYSLELLRLSRELSQGLLSGDSGHVGAEEPAWSLLELGCRRPRGELASKAAVSPPVSFHWGTGLPQRCVVPSFSPPMTYDSRELSGLFHLFLRKS